MMQFELNFYAYLGSTIYSPNVLDYTFDQLYFDASTIVKLV